MKSALLNAAGAAVLIVGANPLNAQTDPAFDRAVAAVQSRMELIDQQEGRIPGRALVFVDADGQSVVDVHGVADVETGRTADENTPFYIASMTKAFVGLMAVRLDMDGTLSLDTTLAEIYPTMQVEGVDLSQVTLRDALSHKLGFNSPALSFRTAYTDAVPVSEFATVVNASQDQTDPAFSYANLGYLLYAGALEQRTGRSWKSWLDELVLHPLGMRHTSARSSDLPRVSKTHEIYNSGWRSYNPKPDRVSHAAGGLFVSGADMARWLAANAGGDSPLEASLFNTAHASLSETSRADGPVSCTGYSLGWTLCDAAGIRFLEHGGTYTGARSEMIVLPDQGVGFAAMFNSDSMTGGLGRQLFTTFVLAYSDANAELPPADAFANRYGQIADRYRDNRSQADERGSTSDWRPSEEQLAQYGGRYSHPAFGRLLLSASEGALLAELNGTPLVLHALADDHYSASISTGSGLNDFKFQRGEDGAIVAIDSDGDIFTRD